MQFGVLGPLRVEGVAGETIDIASPKQRRLLAALLVAGGAPVSTDRLVAALWGEEPPKSALASLRTYVYRLRDTLGDDGTILVSGPAGYRMAAGPDRLDAARFERLVEEARRTGVPADRADRLTAALGLWRGSAYAELADLAAVRNEAQRLEQLRVTVEEEHFGAMIDAGRHAEVVADLEAFVARHLLREAARCHLAVALHRAGRQSEALATLRELRVRLADELGLDPSEQVAGLERDLLRRAAWLQTPPSDPGGDEHRDTPGAPRLPVETTELIGRDEDVRRLVDELAGSRLVTVVGVGGVGKTRLALRAAHATAGAGFAEVRWCELATIGRPAEVASAVGAALDLRPPEPEAATGAVVTALHDRAALLVLDNAEHVRDAVAVLADEVLGRCPAVRLLVTSRAPIGLPAERIHRLAPLPVAADDRPDGGDGAAVELLIARARAVRPALVGRDAEHGRLVELCRRLDGLPLAIELAASRLRTLNPVDLLARLDDRPDLVAADEGRAHRHAGLRTVLDWSFLQLSSTERRLFSRLSVFPGLFTLDAVEAICAGDGIARDETAELLGRLVDHSLVELRQTGGAARYGLLETIRAYGREDLAGGGEEDAVRRRHAKHHVALAISADEGIRGRDEASAVRLLDGHLDDLRAAHHWAVSGGDTRLAIDLVAPLFRYALWRLRGEVLRWAETVADLPGAEDHPRWPIVAGMAGWGAGLRGELEVAESWADRVLDVVAADDHRTLAAREVRMHTALWGGRLDDCLREASLAAALTEDPYELVPAYVPGLAHTYAGRPEEALQHLGPVQEAADRHGAPTMRALVRYARAEALLETTPTAAHAPLEEAVAIASEVDNRVVLGVADVSLIGLLSRDAGDTDGALATFPAVIERLRRAGDWTHLWTGLRGLVGLLAPTDPASAAVLLGAVRGAATAPPVYGEDARRLAVIRDDLEEALGREAFDAATARGRAMPDHKATDLALAAIDRRMTGV